MSNKVKTIILLICILVGATAFVAGVNWGSSIWDSYAPKQESVNS